MSKLALSGGNPVHNRPFPVWPQFDNKEVEAVSKVVQSGKWGRYEGEEVNEFEKEFAQFHDVKYALGVTNGTTALEVALAALGIGPGDEVIVPAYTFVATASCVLTVNAVPVFADIDDDFNICLDSIKKVITPRTKAIIPVHFAGYPCNIDELLSLAQEYGLYVVEDTAHGHGGNWKGRKFGTLGHCSAFSFQSSKNMTSGEGGAFLTDDEDLFEKAKSLHSFGRLPGRPWYEHHIYSGNLRMTEFQAAILRVQLSRLQKQNELRAKNAKILIEGLSKIPGIIVSGIEEPMVSGRVYHIFMTRYLSEYFNGVSKRTFVKALNAEGIPAVGGYPVPLYRQNMFTKLAFKPNNCPVSCSIYDKTLDYNEINLPNSERACQEAIWFTQNLLLGDENDMNDIIFAFEKLVGNLDDLIQFEKED